MKTATQSLPKHTVYPLQPVVKKEKENAGQLSIVRQAEKTSVASAVSLASNPFNWDEAWFTNYE